MYHLFTMNETEFNRHYHKRSNVETTFHMLKAKFGGRIRAKTDTAQVNDALMKVLCHNICVLIRAMYKLGITYSGGRQSAAWLQPLSTSSRMQGNG